MQPYAIDRESDTPLYIQIRNHIRTAIAAGDLRPGDRLPPVAALAKEIGVTQATVRRALQDLGAAGLTACHVGRGTFVQDPRATGGGAEEPAPEVGTADQQGYLAGMDGRRKGSRQAETSPLEFAARKLRAGVSKALYDIMPLAHREDILQLTKGVPDPHLLPERFLEDLTAETLRSTGNAYLEATDALGHPALREEIARRSSQAEGPVTPDQVLITNGSLQALTLVAQAALEDRPAIICETPCYQGIINSFTAMGHWAETVPRDEEGPDMGVLRRHTKGAPPLLYLCPYAHNPSGRHLSSGRAGELAMWARETGGVLIADEIFKDIGYPSAAPSSLLDTLGSRQTIVISSLSKSFASGLRIGWLISSADRVQKLAGLKRLMDHCAPTLMQAVALKLFTSGRYDTHIDWIRTRYQARMETLVHALEQHMPAGVTWSRPQGGFSILVELPRGYSSVALLLSAIDKGVSFLPGPLFDIDHRYVNAMRLSVAWTGRDQLKEAVELLASAIEAFIREPPGDSGLSGLGHYQ